MKRIVLSFIHLILAIAVFTGCKNRFIPQRREIDDLLLVQVVGIDESEKTPGNVVITIASRKMEEVSGSGSKGDSDSGSQSKSEKALILSAEGETVFQAVRNLQMHSDRSIFWGHSAYYLISEGAIKDNIFNYIDFFTRDHELRIEANIYVVQDISALEMMKKISETDYYIVDKLDSLGRNIKVLGTSQEMKISDLMRSIDNHHASARLPFLKLTKHENDDEPIDVEIGGYAIISEHKLKGYLENDISRGVNLITNNIDSSAAVVKDPSGNKISLEIISSKTKVRPQFEGNELTKIILETEVKSNLDEIQSSEDVFDEKKLKFMEDQQSEILKKEMEEALKKIIEYKSDCLEICDRVRLRHPLKWRHIEDRWMEIFTSIEIDVQVRSIIERTYVIREPSGSKPKGSKRKFR